MNPSVQVFVIGRASPSYVPDLALPASEDTVGRRHAELKEGGNGSYFLTDTGSANGTFVFAGGKWKRIQQATVERNTPIRLGTYETTVEKLLAGNRPAMSPPPFFGNPAGGTPPPFFGNSFPPPPPPPPPAQPMGGWNKDGRKRRNPFTGEVE